jgi:Fe-S oxidoreductase
MALEDYRENMEICSRCSACKFIPLERVEGLQHVNICPSIARYNFHAYSGGGRLGTAIAKLDKRFDYSKKLVEVMYNCQTCGGCDVSCKYGMDMEVLEPIYEFRIKTVKEGHTHPALDTVINTLKKHGTMVPGLKANRAEWAQGLDVKDITKQKVKVLYHVGCLNSYDREMWKVAKATVNLLKKAGVDFGIAGENESCCGGRAYQMGYKEDFLNQARKNMEMIKKSGVETLITTCADGYHAFKVLYDKFNLKGNLEILHITEYLARLVKEGKLKPTKKIDINVTYHDPCHLGRLGEKYIHWEGKRVPGHMYRFEPQRVYRRGANGTYEPPRDILRSIPGIKLVEMDRRKEYAWCCGAGGGVNDSNHEFSMWTARERIREAEDTGAEAIVTACSWCVRNFYDAIKEIGSNLKIYDIVELLAKAI